MSNIAFIPARGGSKRIPRKNIIDFNGVPMIAHTIRHAQRSGCFSEIVVSTEDNEIATIASSFGAIIDDRDPLLANDTADVTEVCIDYLLRHKGRKPAVLCCLYAAAPLRNESDIRAVVDIVASGAADFSLATTWYDLPPHQALILNPDNTANPAFPNLIDLPSRDVPKMVVDNGSTYAVRPDAFLEQKTFFGTPLKVYTMPRERSQDIDEVIDLELARFFAARKQDSHE